MGNQRKKGKKLTAAWVMEKDYDKLTAIAEEHGLNNSDVLKALIEGLSDMDKKAINKLVKKAKGE